MVSQLVFEKYAVAFERLPFYGKGHLLSRLAGTGDPVPGIPVFTPADAGWSSESPFAKSGDPAAMISRANPEQPAVTEGTRFVVAGQQPGLLIGPLYTFLKAVTAIRLAARLSEECGESVLPLFWVAAEDHDILEVNRTTVNGKRFVHPFDGEIRRGKVPQVGEIPLRAARQPLLDFLGETLRESAFNSWLMDEVARADFTDYGTAFQDLMRFLFKRTPLRLIDPRGIRRFTGPVLARLIERWPEVRDAFDEGCAALRAAGFEPPLAQPGAFEIVQGRRVPLAFSEDCVTLSEGTLTFEEAATFIRTRPDDFSPGAALRPVLQDAVLPVVATVGGPTELLYLWQIDPLFALADVKRSRLQSRISATFVEAAILKAAKKSGFGKENLFAALDDSKTESDDAVSHPRIDRLEKMAQVLLTEIDALATDPRAKWLGRSRATLAAQLAKMVRKLRELHHAANDLEGSRRAKIVDAVAPGGKPQERVAGIFEFLNRHGPDFIDRCLDTLDPLAKQHQVIFITTRKPSDNPEAPEPDAMEPDPDTMKEE